MAGIILRTQISETSLNSILVYMDPQDDASVFKITLKGKVSTRSFEGLTDVGFPYLFQV